MHNPPRKLLPFPSSLPVSNSVSFAKIWFVLSLSILTFGYGVAVGKWGWFPHSFLDRAMDQARSAYTSWSPFAFDPTGTHDRVYEKGGTRLVRPDQVEPGLTLITSSWRWGESEQLEPGAKLVDQRGNVVHQWQIDRTELFTESTDLINSDPEKTIFHGTHLFPNGDLLLLLSYIGVVRVDACGEVVWRVKQGNHHSIARADDGSFWIPGTSQERTTSTPMYPNGLPGIEEPIWMDVALNISRDGKVLNKTNIYDVLYNNNMERYIAKAFSPYPENVLNNVDRISNDYIHLNDLEPISSEVADEYPTFEKGDLVASLRHPSLVFVFDPDSKEIKWHSSEEFTHQHDPDFIGEGWIGILDNNSDFSDRGQMLGGSRIVAVQPHSDSVEVRFPTSNAEPFYTSTRGKWQKLENGNMLLTEANAGRVAEVNQSGRTVWEWIHKPYRSEVPVVTKGTRYDLTREDVASWPCSSGDSLRTSLAN